MRIARLTSAVALGLAMLMCHAATAAAHETTTPATVGCVFSPGSTPSPTLSATATTVLPSTKLTVTGSGWPVNTAVQGDIESRENAFNMFAVQTDGSGNVAIPVTADGTPGNMLISVTCGSLSKSLTIIVALNAPSATSSASPAPAAAPPAAPPPAQSGFPWWLILIAIAILIVIAWITLWRRDRDGKPAPTALDP